MKEQTKSLLKETFYEHNVEGKLTLLKMKRSTQIDTSKFPVVVLAVNKQNLLFMYSFKQLKGFTGLDKAQRIECIKKCVDKKLGVTDSVREIVFNGKERHQFGKKLAEAKPVEGEEKND